jgi:peptidoglycan/xylan/chitin deacetylase (PgdA/CDA1 family)
MGFSALLLFTVAVTFYSCLVSGTVVINRCLADKDVALTFDDGPSLKTTRLLMSTLESIRAPATFHITTKHFDDPDVRNLVKEMYNRGYQIGYRLEAEWELDDVTTRGVQGAVNNRLEMIKSVIGEKPLFVRTSFNTPSLVTDAISSSGLIVTIPSFETYDYRPNFTIEAMISRLEQAGLKSQIIVQREFAPELIETTKSLVQLFKQRGYNLVDLRTCLNVDRAYVEVPSIKPLKTFELSAETSTSSPALGSSSANKIISGNCAVVVLSLLSVVVGFVI